MCVLLGLELWKLVALFICCEMIQGHQVTVNVHGHSCGNCPPPSLVHVHKISIYTNCEHAPFTMTLVLGLFTFRVLEISEFIDQLPVDDDNDENSQLNLRHYARWQAFTSLMSRGVDDVISRWNVLSRTRQLFTSDIIQCHISEQRSEAIFMYYTWQFTSSSERRYSIIDLFGDWWIC